MSLVCLPPILLLPLVSIDAVFSTGITAIGAITVPVAVSVAVPVTMAVIISIRSDIKIIFRPCMGLDHLNRITMWDITRSHAQHL